MVQEEQPDYVIQFPSEQPLTPDAKAAIDAEKRTSLEAIVPSDQGRLKFLLPLIGLLRGRKPDIVQMYRAHALWEVRLALREHRDIKWSDIDPVEFLKSHAPSLDGRRAQEVVQIARSTVEEKKQSMLGGFKR